MKFPMVRIIKPVNQGYSNINPDIELHLLSNTNVKKFDVDLSITNITLNFMIFEKATKSISQQHIDCKAPQLRAGISLSFNIFFLLDL